MALARQFSGRHHSGVVGLKKSRSKVVSLEPAGYTDVYNSTVDEHHSHFIGGFEGTTVTGRPKQQFVLAADCCEQTPES